VSFHPEEATERFPPVRSITQPPSHRIRRSIPQALNAALWWGELAFVAAGALGVLVALLENALGGLSLGAATVLRAGGLYFFGFNHVRIDVTVAAPDVDGPLFGLSVALLTGTAVAVGLLFVGGRSAGRRAGGGAVARAAWGSLCAIPYAALSLLVSFAVGIGFALPRGFEGGAVTVAVSHVQAFLWPLAIGAIAGAVGGLWSLREERDAPSLLDAAVRGGWLMLAWGMGLAFVGLLVLAAAKPGSTRAYLDRTAGGGASGVGLMLHHALALPNQSMGVLLPAMGGCDHLTGVGEPSEVLCYGRFPVGGDPGAALLELTGVAPSALDSPLDAIEFEPAPRGFLLFLLVPVGATLIGGLAAGSGQPSTWMGVAGGALSGLVFALLVVVASVLAGISLHVGVQAPTTATLGPDPAGGGAAALAWGVGGGVVGGLLSRLRSDRERSR
jgi:hypothetical protein